MANDAGERTPLDEGAALAELERLAQQIARAKARRHEVGDEFEKFVQSFKNPPAAVPGPSTDRRAVTNVDAGHVVAGDAPVEAAEAAGPVTFESPVFESPRFEAPPPVPQRARSAWSRPALVGGTLIAVAGGLLAVTLLNRARSSPSRASAGYGVGDHHHSACVDARPRGRRTRART
jgi:hypothetical protein